VLVESAARLCEAHIANIWRPKGTTYKLAAAYQATPENKEYLQNLAIEPGRGSCVARTLLEGKIVHIHDIQADPEYVLTHLTGYRTMLGVPRNSDRRYCTSAERGPAFHRKTNRVGDHLCRPGSDRHRERAVVRRGAGAQAGADRGP